MHPHSRHSGKEREENTKEENGAVFAFVVAMEKGIGTVVTFTFPSCGGKKGVHNNIMKQMPLKGM